MSKNVLIPIADGVEDLETVTIIDVLRRAKANVIVASIHSKLDVTAARQTRIVADSLLSDYIDSQFDLIALPGGLPGAENLRDCEPLIQLLKTQKETGNLYGAICASPAYVLQTHGLLQDVAATCYPAFHDQLSNHEQINKHVVVSKNCITSQGPGTALEFALTLVELLYDEALRREIAGQMLVGQE